MWVLQYFKKRKTEYDLDNYTRGYAYAAGQLLLFITEGGDPEAMLTRLNNEACNPFDRSAFDKGIEAALLDWRKLHN